MAYSGLFDIETATPKAPPWGELPSPSPRPASPSIYHHKEPIMDKNAVAFIRTDVRSLECVFITTEKGRTTPLSNEEISLQASSGKKYTYLTTDPTIKEADWVLVMANGIPKAVFVVSASFDLDIEPNADYTYAYIISKVDFAEYNRLNSQNRAISDMLRSSYKETLRQGFRNTLLAGLAEDQQNQITLLLNSKES